MQSVLCRLARQKEKLEDPISHKQKICTIGISHSQNEYQFVRGIVEAPPAVEVALRVPWIYSAGILEMRSLKRRRSVRGAGQVLDREHRIGKSGRGKWKVGLLGGGP